MGLLISICSLLLFGSDCAREGFEETVRIFSFHRTESCELGRSKMEWCEAATRRARVSGGEPSQFTYNGNSQVLTQKDPLGKTTTYTYDAAGNLDSVTDRLGRVRRFTYDNLNRLTTETWVTSGQTVKQIAMSYDASGNVLTAGDDVSTHTFTYDNRNRVQTETVTYPSTVNRSYFTLAYTYNDQTRTYTVTDAEGVTVTTKLDERSLLSRLTWSGGDVANARVDWTRNDLGDSTEMRRYTDLVGTNLAIKTVTELDRKRTDVGYSPSAYNANGDSGALDGFGNTEAFGPLGVAPDSGSLAAPGSSPLKRITEITHTNGAGTELLKETYGHDVAGQLTSETFHAGTKEFSYDATGQLKTVTSTIPALAESFNYDVSGNRTQYNNGPLHVIAASNRVESDGTWTYGYDDEGNLTGKATATERWAYTYDHRNRMTKAEKFDGANTLILTAINGYDVLDRRIQKSVSISSSNPLITSYSYYGDHIWSEIKPDATVIKYIVGDGIDQWVARHSTSGGLNWYLSDRLGSVKALTNASGTPLVNYSYSSFGQRTVSGDFTRADSFGFTGREQDSDTGLMYFRARYYDPHVGKFLSEDPIGFGAGDFNKSRYAINSPNGYLDPLGLMNGKEYENVLRRLNVARGKAFEVLLNVLSKKTTVIYRGLAMIPDKITQFAVVEAKAVAYQALTAQIRNYLAYSVEKELFFILVVTSATKLSQPLIQAVNAAGGIIIRVPFP